MASFAMLGALEKKHIEIVRVTLESISSKKICAPGVL